jgi:hypothetical protein
VELDESSAVLELSGVRSGGADRAGPDPFAKRTARSRPLPSSPAESLGKGSFEMSRSVRAGRLVRVDGREEANIVVMKCFGVCSREIRVCRSPTASGLAVNFRRLGVIGPMIRRAIADPRESDVLPPGRLRCAPGRTGRTIVGAPVVATETRSAHEKTGGASAARERIESASDHPPPIALPCGTESFWAGLVFRYARALHGSVQLGVQPCSQAGAAALFSFPPSSVPTRQGCRPAGELGSPEPLHQALQTLLAGMARRRVRASATEGETRHDRREDPEHTL